MKKLLFTSLSGVPNENSGGPNKIIHEIIRAISKNDFYIFFLSKNGLMDFTKLRMRNLLLEKKISLTQAIFNKIKLYRSFFTATIYLKYFFNEAINKITREISNSQYDIIHSHDIRTLFKLHKKPHSTKKLILSLHSKGSIVNDMIQFYGKRRPLLNLYERYNNLEKRTLEIVDIITFPSISAKDLFFEDLNMNSYNYQIKIIHNGININLINNIEIDDEFSVKWGWLNNFEFRLITVGSHIKVKNIDLILKVFSNLCKLRKDKCVLICIGSGNKTNELIKLADTLRIGKYVHFISYLPNIDIIKLMKMCNIYISLSERVIFDMVILEALACGLNVFASNDGGNREVIDNTNGTLVDINDLDDISHKLLNSNLSINEKAKNSVNKFSLEFMVKNYTELYNE